MTHLLLAAAVLTMRVDYYHTGNEKQERFSLDRVVVEPLPWPGDPQKNIDTTMRGNYFFEVVDEATKKTLYSRGFASIYAEWETTAEAKTMNRTFSESLRFPSVDKPAQIVLKKRDAKNVFQELWTTRIDPADKFIVRAGPLASAGPLIKLHERGNPATKLDLLVIGDGYTSSQRAKFERDAKRLLGALFATSPFKERENDINVWGLVPPSMDSGISSPSQHIYK
ncbi:MAG TPA: peptidase M64 N-terminal domain-containing protein, partial [Vicinamibacterales bacterium]|nr:peptidase M64 N-terminal domain-containing protein [Vicinamibacterales bacterium]